MFDFNDVLPSFKLCNHLLHEYYLLTAEMATCYLLSLHIGLFTSFSVSSKTSANRVSNSCSEGGGGYLCFVFCVLT